MKTHPIAYYAAMWDQAARECRTTNTAADEWKRLTEARKSFISAVASIYSPEIEALVGALMVFADSKFDHSLYLARKEKGHGPSQRCLGQSDAHEEWSSLLDEIDRAGSART